MYTDKEQLIKLKESNTLEFKKAKSELPKSFWETYSAFCNSEGGLIILGLFEDKINNKNIIEGVYNPDKIIDDLWNLLSNKNKVSFNNLNNNDIKEFEIDGKTLIFIDIKPVGYLQKPVYLNNKLEDSYKRTGDGDRRLSKEELKIMFRNSSNTFDVGLLENYSIVNDLDMISIIDFKSKISLAYPDMKYEEMILEDFLHNIKVLNLDRNDNKLKITKAGLLFFGKYNSIKDAFPHFHLDYLNTLGNNERWTDRVASDEPQIKQMNLYNFFNIVKDKLSIIKNNEFRLNDKQTRELNNTIYTTAVREALVNTLAHADYQIPYPPIKIEINEGNIKFTNPGGMLINKNDFLIGGCSKPRNEIIMSFFRKLGESERQGFGGKKIFQYAEDNKFRTPDIDSSITETELTLWQISILDSYPDLTENDIKIFHCISGSFISISTKSIIEDTNISEYYTRKSLNKLLEKNLISKIGNGKSTKYTPHINTTESKINLKKLIDLL